MIQIDISMPKTCYECPCHDGDNSSCQITGKYYFDEIPKSCPLKEVEPAELQKNKMTINDIIDILSAIPSRERDRPVAIIGDIVADHAKDLNKNHKYEISWIDCSNGMLLIIDEEVCK